MSSPVQTAVRGRPRAWVTRRTRRKPTRQKRIDHLAGYLYLLPAVAFLGVLIVYPIAKAVQYSLEQWDGIGPASFVGAHNWVQLFWDPVERSSLIHQGILLVFFSFIPAALALPVAGLVGRMHGRSVSFFRALFFVPQVIIINVVAIIATWIFSPTGGASLNGILHGLGIGSNPGPAWLGQFSTALLAIGLMAVWLDFGLCFVLYLSGVQRISPELYDAARVAGAGFLQEFIYITVPMIRREISAAITVTAFTAIQSFTLIFQATDGGPGTATMVPGVLVYRDAFQLGQVGAASALGLAMAILIFILAFGVRALLERNAV